MKVLVFELNSFHIELLPMCRVLMPSLFDNRELDIHYYLLPSLVERARDVVGAQVHTLNSSRLRYALPTKRLRSIYYRWRIQKLVDRLDPVAIIFNTVEPQVYLDTFRGIRHPLKIGIVHNPRRERIDYQTGGPGELIFCLHEYNYHLLEKDKPVDGYLSPFFKYLDVSTESEVKERVEIAVQGVISFGRRDYPMLIELCEQLSRQTPRPNVVFNILGDADIRDGPKLRQRVTDLGLGNYFRLHSWLPALEFFRQLQRADYIMPLVSPRQRIYADNVNGHCRVRAFRCLWHASHPASGGRLAVGIPKSACVTYPGTEELGDTLLRGLDDRSRHARRYRAVVAEKIRQNLAILEDLTHNHPAFHAHRR